MTDYMKEMAVDIAFVRSVRQITWLDDCLCSNGNFLKLITDIQSKGKSMTVRNVLYSMLCVADFLEISARNMETFEEWFSSIGSKLEQLVQLSSKGTQGNIPQRAAIVLDYVAKNFDDGENLTIVELGCSGALLGRVFTNAYEIFCSNQSDYADRYFWLAREPFIPSNSLRYIGCDQERPDNALLPFYVWDLEQRKMVASFIRDYVNHGIFMHMSINHFLENHLHFITGKIVLLTSFVLYQVEDTGVFVENILKTIKEKPDIQWIDLSRAQDFPYDESLYHLESRWIHLFHNGAPKARVINGSDDCPNWEYL